MTSTIIWTALPSKSWDDESLVVFVGGNGDVDGYDGFDYDKDDDANDDDKSLVVFVCGNGDVDGDYGFKMMMLMVMTKV